MESTIERTQERLSDHFDVGIPFLVITWLLVLLRLYVRGPMQKRLGLDDLFLCFTLVCSGCLVFWYRIWQWSNLVRLVVFLHHLLCYFIPHSDPGQPSGISCTHLYDVQGNAFLSLLNAPRM